VIALQSSFLTYLLHYVLARLIYDHLVVVLVALVVVLSVMVRSRR
jgi:hypothetical protein